MSEKFTAEELFQMRKEMEERKRQEREDRLIAEELAKHIAKLDSSTDEEMIDEETEDGEIGGDKIEQWDADVTAARMMLRTAAATPESARRMRKLLSQRMEWSPTKKSGKDGKVVKRTSPRKKKGKQVVGPEASPSIAEEVDDSALVKALGGLKSSSSEAPRKSKRINRRGSGLPNNMHETDDDEEEDDTWFPEPFEFEQDKAHRNNPSTDIQLFKGMSTQLVPTHGHFKTPYGHVEYWQQMLQDIPDPFDNEQTVNIGLWTDKRKVGPNVVRPGDVIRATYSVAQNNTDQVYPSPYIRVFRHGPVYSKVRPLVVLWNTDEGMLCLPLYSAEWLKRPTTKDFWKAGFMTIVTQSCDKPQDWEGYTPENGKPLNMIVSPNVQPLKAESFVNIDRPVSISRSEAVQYQQAKFTRESFVRLMEVYTHRENERKEEAFRDLGLQHPTAHPPRAPLPANTPGFEYNKATIDLAKKRLKDIGLTTSEIQSAFGQ
ncbi:hypothetical protein KCU98_g4633, partial [Aureobasidium melanogenum]